MSRKIYSIEFTVARMKAMLLTPNAAIQACRKASEMGWIIARVEGGVWQNPGFMSRIDCIWDGSDPPATPKSAHENNLAAARFIEQSVDNQDVFILTAPPLTGWPHKAKPQ